eukprot:1098444-Prymnesium_polylepis.1
MRRRRKRHQGVLCGRQQGVPRTHLEGGELHELRKEPARRVLGPEALERVVARGREEAEGEVEREDTHAHLQR